MLRFCKLDKNRVIEQIQNKVLDGIEASNSNLIDDIILSMKHEGILDCIENGFPDKRRFNTFIPFNLIIALAIASKMKQHMSLTDIPYAIRDHRTMAELGYNAINKDNDGWMSEGTLRHLISKYKSNDLFNFYNDTVQNKIFKHIDFAGDVHILDCTKIAVNMDNQNYEGATYSTDKDGNKMFGYKLASLRCLYQDTGIIEDIRFGTASAHDLTLSEDILRNSSCLHEGDIILMDRGFQSREIIKYLKDVRKVDTYIPVKSNMSEYNMAIAYAEESQAWEPHPTRKDQVICHVPYVDSTYDGNDEIVVPLNACVVWFESTQAYAVFVTTDMTKSAKDIIMTYELRPEIEEDFRQLKDFWKLEDFTSTKLNVISFHIVCVLLGYLFYQLYLGTEDGQKYIGKCLPVILKNYKEEFLAYMILYSGDYFCSMTLGEFMMFYDHCNEEVKKLILEYIK